MTDSSADLSFSVVLCTHNPDPSVRDTLLSLVKQSIDPARVEVIVVDSYSDNARATALQALCEELQLNYTRVEESGLSLARNRGIQQARGDIIYFIDDDAVAPAHLLDELGDCFAADSGRLVVGGPAHGLWEEQPPYWLSSHHWRMLSLLNYGPVARELAYPEIVIGCNMAFRKQVFSDGLQFAETLGRTPDSLLGGEERYLQKAVYDGGGKVFYSPRAYVFHRVPSARQAADYINKRAAGSEVSNALAGSRSPHGGVHPVARFLMTLMLFPWHILKFGFRDASLKLSIARSGMLARRRT